MKDLVLAQKRAVITGGSDGIGLGIARTFAEAGASVLLIARDPRKLEDARAVLTAFGNEVRVIQADLSQAPTVAQVAREILDAWPQIDVLVNNAGIARFTPFAETDATMLDMHLDLNVKALFNLTRHLFTALSATRGSVINISSFFSHRMLPGRPSTAYSLTKGAIDAFTKALAYEAGPIGMRVNAIAPGTVDTPLVRSNLDALSPEGRTKFMEMIGTIYPLGRLGKPDDIAGAALFLASDLGRWVTGAVLPVDGGLTTN